MAKTFEDIDWALIRSFLAVAETGSLSAAARQLGASQPTLGRQIRQLEDRLQQVLFQRQPKGLVLTENGAALIGPAQRMRAAMHDVTLTAAGLQTGLSGSVRITASETVSLYILPGILAKLRREQPSIQIDIVSTDSTENLLFREADIALRMYRPEQVELVAKKLGEFRFGLYASREYLDRAGWPGSVAELLKHPLIGYDRNEEILRGMIERGLPAKREWFALRCDSNPVNWELVRAGCGVGFGLSCNADGDDSIVHLDIPLDLPTLPVWLVTHQSLRHTPRISAVWAALEEGLAPHLS
ncbi:LysR family transcriptional regulator [Roseovarius faecimaris]|uniref:LysR family transcriptional regulator n=1 Tax=Roseovarius faecimaris TaxID=2494550 RepID=A0A6I6IX75_9RHOB|nr:LysR family transcriptional regulator [Roseovarius faecimaris]QGY00028.1 LysR family transcriptional regulator [Roseovarius faecimaris]